MDYNLRLSQADYTQGGLSQKIRDTLKRVKAYYTNFQTNPDFPQALDYEFEIQSMFPTLSSTQAIGSSNVLSVSQNSLVIKTCLSFNQKRGQTQPNLPKGIQSLSEVTNPVERIEFFCQLVEHLNSIF